MSRVKLAELNLTLRPSLKIPKTRWPDADLVEFAQRQKRKARKAPPAEWQGWLTSLFPAYVAGEFAQRHIDFWAWVWSVSPGIRPAPFVAIWPRGGGKSTSAELAAVALGARGARQYIWYLSLTQEQADAHVENIAAMLESPEVEAYYPDLASRKVGKYGNSKGWRRERLRTTSGLTVDALGLDTARRGAKVEEARPNLIIVDDVDDILDSLATTQKKIDILTHSILPAGSSDLAVLAIQNMVIPDGVFAQLADGRAEFLADRIVSGPYLAIDGLTYEQREGRFTITGGTPTWTGQDLTTCQNYIDTYGLSAFLAESQHEVEAAPGGMFNHLQYQYCDWSEIPSLVRIVVWCDPAVTSTDQSDAMGIQADGISEKDTIYRLWSWENVTTPEDVLRRAILKALELRADSVGCETDQGGDTWESTYREACRSLVEDRDYPHINKDTHFPTFHQAKAGAGHGPKAHRASLMLADYERGKFVHVRGTHRTLERALNRFPKTKPFDLVDAAYWSWNDLRSRGKSAPLPIIVGDSRWGRGEAEGSRWSTPGTDGGSRWRR